MDANYGGHEAHPAEPDAPFDVVASLKTFDFLSELSRDQLEAVAYCGSLVRFPADCLVDEQESEGSSMYLLLSGRVRFWVDDVDLRDITLGYVSAPHFFGELCFLSPGRRSTNVTTCSDVVLLQLDSEMLPQLTELCPSLIRVLTAEVVARCRNNVETLQNTVFRTAKERVLNALLVIVREPQFATPSGMHPRRLGIESDTFLVQGYTHEDLASMAFTTRETVTRTLAELENEGVIEARSAGWLRIRPSMLRARLRSGPIRGKSSSSQTGQSRSRAVS